MAIRTYDQAITFWHDRVNYEQRGMPADLRELKLDRMRELLHRLGHPERTFPIVHVAGSKGKGSTSAMIAAITGRAGLRTGLFTSPHLSRVEERVTLDGRPLSSAQLVELMARLEPIVLDMERHSAAPPTFFEIVTAVGLLHFAGQKVDLAVLEVGLGGRFDATNVCDPLVSIIASISLDHTQQLGTTLASIAREKAGIIKPGRPVVSGVEAAEARRVIEEVARTHNAPLTAIHRDFHFHYEPGQVTTNSLTPSHVSVHTPHQVRPRLELALLGAHQAANAAVAVAAVEILAERRFTIPESAIRRGLARVHWPGRIEVVRRQPIIVVDCAHNTASIESLVATLAESFDTAGKRVLVFSASRDKDLAGMLRLLIPAFSRAFFTRYSSSQRGAAPEELNELWTILGGGPSSVIQRPEEALREALAATEAGDLLCVTGSVFLAGELRPLLVGQGP